MRAASRGQRGNHGSTAANRLPVTFVVDPPAARPTLTSSPDRRGIAETLQRTAESRRIKWPNDILVREKRSAAFGSGVASPLWGRAQRRSSRVISRRPAGATHCSWKPATAIPLRRSPPISCSAGRRLSRRPRRVLRFGDGRNTPFIGRARNASRRANRDRRRRSRNSSVRRRGH